MKTTKKSPTNAFAVENNFPRLTILKNFMKKNGLLYADIAKALGKTQQALFRNFRIDDIYVNELEQAFRYFGYTLTVDIHRYPQDTRSREGIITMEPHIRRHYEDGHLPYLCLAMARYDITILQLARDLGMSDTAMRHMFNVNSISLSRLIQICTLYGLSLYMDIKPSATAEENVIPGNGPRMVCSYTGKKVVTDIPFEVLGCAQE